MSETVARTTTIARYTSPPSLLPPSIPPSLPPPSLPPLLPFLLAYLPAPRSAAAPRPDPQSCSRRPRSTPCCSRYRRLCRRHRRRRRPHHLGSHRHRGTGRHRYHHVHAGPYRTCHSRRYPCRGTSRHTCHTCRRTCRRRRTGLRCTRTLPPRSCSTWLGLGQEG